MMPESEKISVLPGHPWTKIVDLVEGMECGVVPKYIARNYLQNYVTGGSSSVPQLYSTLNFLGFIEGEQHRTTAFLKDFVQEKETRERRLKELVQTCYAPVMRDVGDLSSTTREKIEEAFTKHYHIENDVRRKAISFFLHMAQAAGISLSPYIRTAHNPHFVRPSSRSTKQRANHVSRQVPVHQIMENNEVMESTPTSLQEVRRKTKTITFRTGGGITFSYQAILSQMDEQDRIEMFGLVDNFRRLEQRAEQSQETFQEETFTITFRHDALVTINYAVDLLEMDQQDRMDLFDLVDHFRRLEQRAKPDQGSDQKVIGGDMRNEGVTPEKPIVPLSSFSS